MTTPFSKLMRFAYRWQGAAVLFVIVVFVMVPGYWSLQKSSDHLHDTQACLVRYSAELTTALRQRDAVAATSRAAGIELDVKLTRVLQHADHRTIRQARQALVLHRQVLARLTRTAEANPYPTIQECLR